MVQVPHPSGRPPFADRAGAAAAAWRRTVARMQTVVLTISTSVARGEAADESGPLLASLAEQAGAEIVAAEVVADDQFAIEERLRVHVGNDVAFVFTTGGTGLTADDVTPEATRAVITREAPGYAETLRAQAREHTPLGILTRGVSGVAARTPTSALTAARSRPGKAEPA